MNDLSSEFDTLFIALISNVYTSIHFPHILNDKQAIEIIFDTVNSTGMKRMTKFDKHLGIEHPELLFYLDGPKDLKLEGSNNVVLDNEPFFENVDKKKMKITRCLFFRHQVFKL